MKNSFSKFFAIFLCLIFAACTPKDDKVKIRIVDMQGKHHPMVTRVPELNMQAMANQNMRGPDQGNFASPMANQPQQFTQSTPPDYGAFSSTEIQRTLQSSTQPIERPELKSQSISNTVTAAGSLPQEQNESVEYDLSKSDLTAEKPVKKAGINKAKNIPAKEIQANKGIFVQVGSYANLNSANRVLAKMEKFHKGRIESATTKKAGEKTIYRVLLGPFPNKAKADAVVKKITDSGQEAIITRR